MKIISGKLHWIVFILSLPLLAYSLSHIIPAAYKLVFLSYLHPVFWIDFVLLLPVAVTLLSGIIKNQMLRKNIHLVVLVFELGLLTYLVLPK